VVSDDGIIAAHLGMGEDYSEHDRNPSCDGAIEVLLAAPTQDCLASFERKVKVVATMNHPNIAIIHGRKTTASNTFSTAEFYECTASIQSIQ
jgi:hypothetical protein